MGNRPQILRELIELARPVAIVRRDLAEFPWDSGGAASARARSSLTHAEMLRRFHEEHDSAGAEELAEQLEKLRQEKADTEKYGGGGGGEGGECK